MPKFSVTVAAERWQLSDGPSGKRSFSFDFADLEECLRFVSGSIINFE